MKMKKGQAAMEFLMTYGWAILVVMIVIAALWYFGVLTPTTFLPERCTLGTGIACKDHKINAQKDEIYLTLVNGLGEGIIITKINITGDGNNYFQQCNVIPKTDPNCHNLCLDGCECDYPGGSQTGIHIPNGGEETINISCSSITNYNGKAKAKIYITYYKDTSSEVMSKTIEGELLAKAG